MNFLGVGVWEILLILALAFVILGPQDMSTLGRKAGKTLRTWLNSDEYREIKRTQNALSNLPRRLMDEVGLDENTIAPWSSSEAALQEVKAVESNGQGLPEGSKSPEEMATDDPLSAWARPGGTREEKYKAMIDSVHRSAVQSQPAENPDQPEIDLAQPPSIPDQQD